MYVRVLLAVGWKANVDRPRLVPVGSKVPKMELLDVFADGLAVNGDEIPGLGRVMLPPKRRPLGVFI